MREREETRSTMGREEEGREEEEEGWTAFSNSPEMEGTRAGKR